MQIEYVTYHMLIALHQIFWYVKHLINIPTLWLVCVYGKMHQLISKCLYQEFSLEFSSNTKMISYQFSKKVIHNNNASHKVPNKYADFWLKHGLKSNIIVYFVLENISNRWCKGGPTNNEHARVPLYLCYSMKSLIQLKFTMWNSTLFPIHFYFAKN